MGDDTEFIFDASQEIARKKDLVKSQRCREFLSYVNFKWVVMWVTYVVLTGRTYYHILFMYVGTYVYNSITFFTYYSSSKFCIYWN